MRVINRREFMILSALAPTFTITACDDGGSNTEGGSSSDLQTYIDTLPKFVGETTWNGSWSIENTDTGTAVMEAYNTNNGLRRRILHVTIPTISRDGRVLTEQEQMAVAKKEITGNLCAHEYIDRQLLPTLSDDEIARADAELATLADGLAVFVLSPDEQKSLGIEYVEREFNYQDDGRPFYPNPSNPSESVLSKYVQWDCNSPITYEMLAAIDIMSTRERIINQSGIRNIGQILLDRTR